MLTGVAVLLWASTALAEDVLVQSTFDAGIENWHTFLTGGSFPTSNISWVAGAGHPGGAARTIAPSDSQTSYFSNAEQFPAALRSASRPGLALSFELSTIRSAGDVFFFSADDIAIIQTPGGALGTRLILANFFTAAPPAHPAYAAYAIQFTVSQGWEYFDRGVRTPATQVQIDTVLANAVALVIRGEYWSGTTPDTTFIDNVVLRGTPSAPPTVTMTSNATLFHPGESLDIDVTVANPGPAIAVDVYFGIVLPAAAGPGLGCPGADAVVFIAAGSAQVTCLSASPQSFHALATNVTLPGALPSLTVSDFFTFTWGTTEPAGTYTVFLVLTPVGAFADGQLGPADLLAVGSQTITFVP